LEIFFWFFGCVAGFKATGKAGAKITERVG